MMPRKVRFVHVLVMSNNLENMCFYTIWHLYIYLSTRILTKCCLQIALGGRYSRDFFNRHGDLRHIRRLRFWPMNKVLVEKYDLNERDAKDMADFLVPILDFVPEKRPTAAQCLSHPWMSAGPQLREPSMAAGEPWETEGSIPERKRREQEEREAMEVGVGNMAINGASKLSSDQEAAALKLPK